jgi:predicted transposase YdaD
MQQGIKKGKKEEAFTIAKKMVLEGFDVKLIQKLVGLSTAELKKLTSH